MSFDLKAQLKRQEGFRSVPYPDADGWSVGYGHWAKKQADLPKKVSKVEAEVLLEQDIEEVEVWLAKAFSQWDGKLTDDRRKVIVNIVFNVGCAGFAPPGKAFYHLIDAIDVEDWDMAGDEIIDSQLAPKRAKELAKIMREG